MLRRFAALLSILLLVQLTLGGSGACVAHEGMPDGAAASLDGGTMSHASPSGQEAPASESPAPDACNLPWSPGTCATMASCAPSVLPSVPVRTASAIDVMDRAAAGPLLAPPTPVRVPELPPPRA